MHVFHCLERYLITQWEGVDTNIASFLDLVSGRSRLTEEYGVISSLDLTYIVKRDKVQLFISNGIRWDSNKLVGALKFLFHLATEERGHGQATRWRKGVCVSMYSHNPLLHT